VAVLRVGGSSAYAVNTSRDTLVRAQRERGQHNASPVRGERQSSGGDKSSKVSGTNRNVSGITWDDAADLLLLKQMRSTVESRNSVCHSATVLCNALMHAGTTVDTFLRENLDWLSRATNWARFSATAGWA